jgi:radical SAM superfamily enzyme YgiQ (UPF0313 family)
MSFRTPAQIEEFIKENQYRFDQPQQFYGDEPNSYGHRAGGPKRWDEATVRVCMFASWPYEQAAGNQSIPLVYKTINAADPNFLCDRSYFMATPRDKRIFDKNGIPVFGIEHRHQLADHDVIGTSISYPVLTINAVAQLKMSDIPVRWKDRQKEPERWPMVIVGGQSFGAPESMGNVADAWFCGEVEDEPGNPGIGAVLKRVEVFKETGLWSTGREECYKRLAQEFNFLYFPRFIDIHYAYQEDRPSVKEVVYKDTSGHGTAKPSKQVVGYSANIPGLKLPITKRFVKDMNQVQALDNPPLLFIDPGMGAGDLEVGRGCPAWCSFCALTYRQKPYRQRSPEYMVEFGRNLVMNTGGLHVAPFSPDFPMHTQKKALISALLASVTDEVDASSMRVDDFVADSEYILLQAHGGMDQVTLGVEGNSQRMRDLVGKGCADEDIKEAVARGIRAGIRRFKLYMICDLPGEDEGDIYRILNLAKDLADIRDQMGQHTVKIQFSWTPLLIEANTPFQWFAPTVTNRALGAVWDEFRDIKIDFKLGSKSERNKQTLFQLMQRSSRDAGAAIIDVLEDINGCWGGVPKGTFEALEASLVEHGFLNGYGDLFDERAKQDMFGWEWLNQGINTELLWVTYQQMKEFLENTDSSTYDSNFDEDYHGSEWIERCDSKCYAKTCGTCDATDLRIRRDYIQAAAEEVNVDLMNVKVINQKSVAMKIRAKLYKDEDKRFVMNDHWKYAVRRAAFRAGLPITKRTVRFASDAIKYKDFTSGVDFVEFGLTQRFGSKEELREIMDRFKQELLNTTVLDWQTHPATAASMRSDIDLSLFEMEIDMGLGAAQAAIGKWNAADHVPMTLKEEARRGGTILEHVNAKDYAPDLWLVKQGHRLLLRALIRGKASPYNIFQALTGKASDIEARKYPAVRLAAFVESDDTQYDFMKPICVECERPIPTDLLDVPFDTDHCPRCKDIVEGLRMDKVPA